jgi:hypothetical protein
MPVLSPSDPATFPSPANISRRWRYTLAKAPLRPSLRGLYANEISRFLRYCEILHTPVTFARAREYVRIIPLPRSRPLAREALRWFFQFGPGGIFPLRRAPARDRPLATRPAV